MKSPDTKRQSTEGGINLTFFPTPSHFREWLQRHHLTALELWVGFYKKDSGKPSITWPESVIEALCFGWIDGIRKRVDDRSYVIRFTPRRTGSIWSSVNLKLAQAAIEQGRMQAAGLKAFAARRENKCGIYSYEQRRAQLEEPYQSIARKKPAAWAFFQAQSPSYKKLVGWKIISAKREETRLKRLEKFMADWSRGRTGRERA